MLIRSKIGLNLVTFAPTSVKVRATVVDMWASIQSQTATSHCRPNWKPYGPSLQELNIDHIGSNFSQFDTTVSQLQANFGDLGPCLKPALCNLGELGTNLQQLDFNLGTTMMTIINN